ncbi:hypothetical protein DPMN_095635 [Dreissena polymorpha]|uniref:Uncharacterized protein n=1 Tax=Dreissena polymorpha TaxID=45954 RepID=A0A9D4R407_DREPO|nr:hypothetical protein DPMN_095635 [Dreissena polymorpha]
MWQSYNTGNHPYARPSLSCKNFIQAKHGNIRRISVIENNHLMSAQANLGQDLMHMQKACYPEHSSNASVSSLVD